jgi:hypothetical protein
VSRARRFPWLWASCFAAACTGPTLDLGESLRDAGQEDGSARDAGAHDAGTHDAGCRNDDDCPSATLSHCAVDSGVCARCTENAHCTVGYCELKTNPANNHCELEGEDDTP